MWTAAGCFGGDPELVKQRIADTARVEAHARCLAHSALQNYLDQCEAIGAMARVERRTYVCEDAEGNRNPPGMGSGPFCVCPDQDEQGVCMGETDCDQGIEEKCAPLLEAEVQNFIRGD